MEYRLIEISQLKEDQIKRLPRPEGDGDERRGRRGGGAQRGRDIN